MGDGLPETLGVSPVAVFLSFFRSLKQPPAVVFSLQAAPLPRRTLSPGVPCCRVTALFPALGGSLALSLSPHLCPWGKRGGVCIPVPPPSPPLPPPPSSGPPLAGGAESGGAGGWEGP